MIIGDPYTGTDMIQLLKIGMVAILEQFLVSMNGSQSDFLVSLIPLILVILSKFSVCL